MENRFILASRSPRRHELLKQIGLDFDVIPSGTEEDYIHGERPEQHVIRLSEAKALEVRSCYPDRWVIAADTVVSIGNWNQLRRRLLEKLCAKSGSLF